MYMLTRTLHYSGEIMRGPSREVAEEVGRLKALASGPDGGIASGPSGRPQAGSGSDDHFGIANFFQKKRRHSV